MDYSVSVLHAGAINGGKDTSLAFKEFVASTDVWVDAMYKQSLGILCKCRREVLWEQEKGQCVFVALGLGLQKQQQKECAGQRRRTKTARGHRPPYNGCALLSTARQTRQ